LQGLLDVIAADDNAAVKVLRLRIKDEASNQGGGVNMLAPMEGDDPASCAPVADDSTVRMECGIQPETIMPALQLAGVCSSTQGLPSLQVVAATHLAVAEHALVGAFSCCCWPSVSEESSSSSWCSTFFPCVCCCYGIVQAVTDETLKKLDATYLRDLRLQGVERIQKVFLRQSKALFPDLSAPNGFRSEDEWVLDTEGVNLMGVSAYHCSRRRCCRWVHLVSMGD
jgi:hypothetical protein